MSNVIKFLEKLGQDAPYAQTPSSAIDLAAQNATIDPEIVEILKAGDRTRLLAVLGAQSNVCCMILPAKQDDDDKDDEPKEDEDDDKDSAVKGSSRNLTRMALASL